MRQYQRAGGQGVIQRDGGGDGDDFFCAGFAQRPNVGAVVDFVRGEAVVEAVAGEEEDFAAGHASEEQRGGGQAVGRAHDAPSGDFEFGDVGKAAASDNCQHGGGPLRKKAAL